MPHLSAASSSSLGPGGPVLVAPELGGAVVALEVAGTDPDGLDPDERLARFALGNGDLFQAVVVRPVDDDGLHLLRDLIGHQLLLDYVAGVTVSRHCTFVQNDCSAEIFSEHMCWGDFFGAILASCPGRPRTPR
jgi:hypothetical protein